MTMVPELEAAIGALTHDDFQRFLIRLTHNLTVAARHSYRPEPMVNERSFQRLRTINELIHTIGNKQLRDRQESSDFSTPVFLKILAEVAGSDCGSDLEWAVRAALNHQPSQQS
jgi:hypothetical protein